MHSRLRVRGRFLLILLASCAVGGTALQTGIAVHSSAAVAATRTLSTAGSRAAVNGTRPRLSILSNLRSRHAGADDHPWKAEATPIVFFLFLTRTGVDRPDLWNEFLRAPGSEGRYRVFQHCEDRGACMTQKPGLFTSTVVDSVPTQYCEDLVSAMTHLLKAALSESTTSNDKFVWLSESTLPVKPFTYVHKALTSHAEAEFCVHPEFQWPTLTSDSGAHPRLLKHSQWSILGKSHATVMVKNWAWMRKESQGSSKTDNLLWAVPILNQATQDVVEVGRLKYSTDSCTDEWAAYASVFGAVNESSLGAYQNLKNGDALPGVSGARHSCRTFAYWSVDQATANAMDLVNAIGKDWPQSDLRCADQFSSFSRAPKCQSTHPVEFRRVSDRGAELLRRSPFLFARKFEKDVVTGAQFANIILAK